MKNIYIYLFLSILLIGASVFLLLNGGRDTNVTDLKQEEGNDIVVDEGELRSKIGQMLIVGFRGSELDRESGVAKAIKELNLGGVILFDYDVPSRGEEERNIINPEQTKKLVSDLKSVSPTLFVAVDAEGGLINRLKEKYGFANIPSAQDMGQGTLEETKEKARFLSGQLKELGFNVNFAPVIDVNINTDNPIIGKLGRSFGEDADSVFEHASQFIAGLNENNIISAVKHFPGHGSSEEDSHLGLVDVTNAYKEEEITPYRRLVESGYKDMIMTAHVVNRDVDPEHPATLSPLFLQNILREDVGFEGVIVSDDMQMGAITEQYGFKEAIIMAVNAGCDLLIISNNGSTYDEDDYYKAVDAIFDAVMSGEIDVSRIDESYRRITDLKSRYSVL